MVLSTNLLYSSYMTSVKNADFIIGHYTLLVIIHYISYITHYTSSMISFLMSSLKRDYREVFVKNCHTCWSHGTAFSNHIGTQNNNIRAEHLEVVMSQQEKR